MVEASEAGATDDAPAVAVRVPGLLARFADGRRTVEVGAATVGECVERLVASYPALEPHLLDGGGRLRPHLQLFREGTAVAWSERDVVALADGDDVVVLQAVSGG